MATTLKDAADDAAFIRALNALNEVATKADLNTKVNIAGDNATDAGVNAMLGKLAGANVVAKVDGSNATDAGVAAMLDKLTGNNKVVKADGTNANNLLKDLAAPTPNAVAEVLIKDYSFTNAIKANVDAQDKGFQEAVRKVMSQPVFEIPADESAPTSYDFV